MDENNIDIDIDMDLGFDIYDIITDEIWNKTVPDSKIIENLEYVKHNDPEFNINECYINLLNDHYEAVYRYLTIAVDNGRKELVEYLLTYPNIDVNCIYMSDNSHDRIPLYHTSMLYIIVHSRSISIPISILILKLFLNRKDFDVNIQGYEGCYKGCTGLHDASDYNKIEIVRELLLDARVDISICSKLYDTALNIAIKEGHHKIANMLKNTGYTFLLRIPNASLCRDIVRMIIEEYT